MVLFDALCVGLFTFERKSKENLQIHRVSQKKVTDFVMASVKDLAGINRK